MASWQSRVTSLAAIAFQAFADKHTIHFVPHSHLDAGWLKTIDEYFDLKVDSIFHSSLDMLIKN